VPISEICSAVNCTLFDHLVETREQRRWHGEAKHFGGREVDDQLELRVSGRGTYEAHVDDHWRG
jgi:hypothetical protein